MIWPKLDDKMKHIFDLYIDSNNNEASVQIGPIFLIFLEKIDGRPKLVK